MRLGLGLGFSRGGDGIVVPAATWNPADKGTGSVLSNGDLTAASSGGFQSVRSTRISGAASYYEVTIGGGGPVGLVGVANASAVLTNNFVGQSTHGCGYYSDGSIYINNVIVATQAAFIVGSVLNIAVKRSVNKVWFGKDGVYGGDPSAGTGGIDITAVAGDLFAGASPAAGTQTGNFGASAFVHAFPTGFAAWNA